MGATLMASGANSLFERVFRHQEDICRFQKTLIEWFRSVGRDYPWRQTRDPYPILVSEAMLQQTQIATVLGRGYFVRWMAAFPCWGDLAAASEEAVLKQWEGLGYYNRARNLHKTAKIISRDYGGHFPEDAETILSLPGVGRYTAGAVTSFAFNRRAAVVDGNVSRVFSRIFALTEPIDTPGGQRVIWEWAEALTPEADARLYNSALMELGQRICGRSSPDCPGCPVRFSCLAEKQGLVAGFPVKKGGKKTTLHEERVVITLRNGRVLLCPEEGSRRKGLWRLPEISLEEAADLTELFRFNYAITRYRVRLMVFVSPSGGPFQRAPQGAKWFPEGSEETMPPIGSPYRKALRMFTESRDDLIMKG